jgi:glycosyltransferase involved in cell wall biosynthesis
MRIAFVTFEYPPFIGGGAGIYAYNLCNELSRLGNEVIIFTPEICGLQADASNSENISIRYVKVHHSLPFKALHFWMYLPDFLKKANDEQKIDIIHFNGLSYVFFKNRLLNVPHIITIHHLVINAMKNNHPSLISRIHDPSGEMSLFIPFIEQRNIHCADKIIAVSRYTKKSIIDIYKVIPEKIETIYNGVRIDACSFSDRELNEIKRRYNPDDKPLILFVGRIDDPRKGLNFLLRAFKLVLIETEAMLLIVGKGDQTRARELAQNLGVFENIIFTGFVNGDTLRKFYAVCSVYVSTSNLEGFGLTIAEAIAAGKPVVARNVGALSEVVNIEKNGILVEPDDMGALVNAILGFIINRKLNKFDKLENIKYIKDNFNWKKCAGETEKIYAKLVNNV